MGLLLHIRSKSRLKHANGPEAQVYNVGSGLPARTPSQLAWKLPQNVLARIFAFVCPHTRDESYTTCEDSMTDEGCMLCQMRDLAHCAYMCRQWASVAQSLLYQSVRIDAVHFCDREEESSSKRRHKGRSDRNTDPQNATEERMKLFYRTVKDNSFLGSLVKFLKMPYMTRESCKADLARIASVLPNLQYIDLPDGVYTDEPASLMLKQELESRCLELRTMKYLRGSEQTFTMLPHRRMWQSLEVLDIHGLEVDADALLLALASFPVLHEVRLGEMMALNDEILTPNPSLPFFPPLQRLILDKAPSVTARGLAAYLSRPDAREVLSFLRLADTGVSIAELHLVLASAPNLVDLHISETVSRPFPLSPIPPLASTSLQKLFFGILPQNASANPPVSESYYNYLASSLLSSSLPSLASLYVYSEKLPDTLLPMPELPFAERPSTPKKPATMHVSSLNTDSSESKGGSPPAAPPLSAPLVPPAPFVSSPIQANPNMSSLTSRISTYSIASSQSSASRAVATDGHAPPTLAFTGLSRSLDVFTKPPAAPELEWSLTTLFPPSERNGRRGSASATRPLSLVALEANPRFRDRSRSPGAHSAAGRSLGSGSAVDSASSLHAAQSPSRSQSETAAAAGRMLVGNGFGGFLSVPGAEAQREASGLGLGHGRQGSRSKGGDWMG